MATTESYKKSRRVREITVNLTSSDTTSAEMFRLPKGARIVQWLLKVETAFSGGTTTIDIGTGSDGDYFVDGAALGTAGLAAIGSAMVITGWEATEITPIYMNVGASNTAGEVDVTCMFSQVVDRRF
jgi:hypothetical protein